MIQEFIKSFISIFVIMDPFGAVPVFISMTSRLKVEKINKAADEAVFTASLLLFLFLFLGIQLLLLFGISLSSFRIAGGILLLILGIKYALNLRFITSKEKYFHASVPVGTPLITGPGTITTVMLLSKTYGYLIPALSSLLCLLITWLFLRYSQKIYNVLGHQGNEIFSRIMGLFITAIAVEFVIKGILEIF
ncbi:MarC family protein [Candidatus Woesearchaeota archaeon]|nr:MarC family protein [Candidatus Woesearchaeota archaeon]